MQKNTNKPVQEPERQDVWKMFDRIAWRYDFLNRVLSMGIDRNWREKMANMLPPRNGIKVLDLATGTACLLYTSPSPRD